MVVIMIILQHYIISELGGTRKLTIRMLFDYIKTEKVLWRKYQKQIWSD